MSRRKGELTAAGIDRGWPFQIAIRSALGAGKNHDLQNDFCKPLSRCARGHTVLFEGEYYTVHCFAEKKHAEAFMERFGGEWFDPRERGRGREWFKWHKGKFSAG